MEKCYRVEFVYSNGQRDVLGPLHATIEQIEDTLNQSCKNHPTIEIYDNNNVLQRVLEG